MTSFSEAAEFAQRWADNQRGMVMISDVLRDLGSMELATKERQAALETATRALEAKKAEVRMAESDLGKLKEQHAADAEMHVTKAGQITEASEMRAADIIAVAARRSKEMLDAADAETARIQAAHAQTMAAAGHELQAARNELANIRKAIAQASAEHAELVPKFEAMREAARGLLG